LVNKDVANKNKHTGASDPSQTEQVDASKESQKKPNQKQFKLKSLQIMLVLKRIKILKTVLVQQHQATRKTILKT
jgi:hypothetical protein